MEVSTFIDSIPNNLWRGLEIPKWVVSFHTQMLLIYGKAVKTKVPLTELKDREFEQATTRRQNLGIRQPDAL
jgi:hypothetical protein